jgi:hypothetical protein
MHGGEPRPLARLPRCSVTWSMPRRCSSRCRRWFWNCRAAPTTSSAGCASMPAMTWHAGRCWWRTRPCCGWWPEGKGWSNCGWSSCRVGPSTFGCPGRPAAPAVELAGLAGEPGEAVVEAPRQWKQVAGSAVSDKAGEYASTSVASSRWTACVCSCRSPIPSPRSKSCRARAASDPWQRVALSSVYRLGAAGQEVVNPDLVTATVSHRYWLLRVDQRGGGLGGVPVLAAGWVPQRLVFHRPRRGTVSTRLWQQQRRAGRLPDRDAGTRLPRRGRGQGWRFADRPRQQRQPHRWPARARRAWPDRLAALDLVGQPAARRGPAGLDGPAAPWAARDRLSCRCPSVCEARRAKSKRSGCAQRARSPGGRLGLLPA